jgi:hypothetical protein
MKTTSPSDDLDQLLGAFFKAQLPHAWPSAPATTSVNEPASLVAARAEAAESPRHQPAAANRDPGGRKARYTLAASVAILLGTCWTLSNGLQSGTRPANGSPNGTNSRDVLGPSSAKTPKEITDVLHPPVAPPGGKIDMLDKSN